MGTLTDTTRVDEAQAELGQVHAHQMIPHLGGVPPRPNPQAALDDAEHRAGLQRIRSRNDPPTIRALLHAVSTVWFLWGTP